VKLTLSGPPYTVRAMELPKSIAASDIVIFLGLVVNVVIIGLILYFFVF
jgi:hypothetical protein